MSRRLVGGPGLLGLLVLIGCGDETATGVGDGFMPIAPRTFEVSLSWDQFAEGFDVFGGFGRIAETPGVVLANQYQGVLDARVLTRFLTYPHEIQVPDFDGEIQADSMYTILGGRLIATFDTTGAPSPVTLDFHRPPGGWDPVSVTWSAAVDSFGVRVPWEEEGAGPATLVATGSWDPAGSDSMVVELDTAAVNRLGDTTALRPGLRIDVAIPGVRADLSNLVLEVDTESSIRQDTVVTFRRAVRDLAFIYSPTPDAPQGDALRVGGAPAWRSILRFALPRMLDGPPDLCAQVGCPFELDPSRLSAATLVLTPRTSMPGFQPVDSVRVDARAVLAPDRLPKSPLGSSFLGGAGVLMAPELFGDPAGDVVRIPVTGFVQGLVASESEDDSGAPPVLALLAVGEPRSLSFASFVAPGQPGEPVLRLVLTTSDTLRVR